MFLRDVRVQFETDHPRGVKETTSGYLRACVQCFDAYLGRPSTVDDLTRETVNKYIDWMVANRSSGTVKSQRCGLLMLWRFAADSRLTDYPSRIRSPRFAAIPVRAWTVAEVAKLRDFCLEQAGRLKNGISVGIYFGSLVAAGYETGFRLADQLSLEREWIATSKGEGRLTIVEAKTGKESRRIITADTMQLIDQCMKEMPNRRLIWPLWARREAFFAKFRELVKASGIREGSYKYLRRTACTDTERQSRGNGQLFLNHSSPAVTKASYIDGWQIDQQPIRVTPLAAYLRSPTKPPAAPESRAKRSG